MISLLDNTVLSNFAAVSQPDLLRLTIGANGATTSLVWSEFQRGIEIGKLPDQGQEWDWLPILTLSEAEKPLFDLFSQRMNAGEASCLAIAAIRGCRVLTDDRDARQIAAQWRIPVSGTLGVASAV